MLQEMCTNLQILYAELITFQYLIDMLSIFNFFNLNNNNHFNQYARNTFFLITGTHLFNREQILRLEDVIVR